MKIFIADYLPLKNKGEEAILRGIEELYINKYKQKIEFGVFDDVDDVMCIGNVTVFPLKYAYPNFKIERDGRFVKKIKELCSIILYNICIYPYARNITRLKELNDYIKSCDRILIGHDGFYNPYCGGVAKYLINKGFKISILGAGFGTRSRFQWLFNRLNAFVFDHCEFVILREQGTFSYVKSISTNGNIYLFPDPAFFFRKAENCLKNDTLINQIKANKHHDQIVIGVTVCENSISYVGSFLKAPIFEKKYLHASFVASVLDNIIKELHCKIVFLPHCIEEGIGNDLVVAERVMKNMKHQENVLIIEDDLPVKELKVIISNLDYVIGERTHSIINSITEQIPFTVLTSSMDFRTYDIVDKGCGLGNQIIYLDDPNINEVTNKIVQSIKSNREIKDILALLKEKHLLFQNKMMEIL